MNDHEKIKKIKKIIADFKAKLAAIAQKKMQIYKQATEEESLKKIKELENKINELK